MNQKVATMRALIAYTALRALQLATTIAVITIFILFIATWALAYYLSPWWWVFLLPIITIIIAAVIIHIIVSRIIHLIHRHPFTESQRQALESFSQKIAHLSEFNETPLPIYAFITLRDIIKHQDAKTLRDAIEESESLTTDFTVLQKHFGDR